MASKIENKKGFLVLKLSLSECRKLGIGIDGVCVCASCNELCWGETYYVAAINECMCLPCLMNFINGATRWDEDKHYEETNFIHIQNLLKL